MIEKTQTVFNSTQLSNPKLRDSSSKIIFADNILSSQFLRDYADMEILRHIRPEDFTGQQYRTVAGLLYAQYEAGELNPAKIINHFTEEEEHREAAALFNTRIRRLSTPEEKVRAIKDSLLRVKSNSIDVRMKKLDPTDMAGLQHLMEEKRQLGDLEKLHISLE